MIRHSRTDVTILLAVLTAFLGGCAGVPIAEKGSPPLFEDALTCQVADSHGALSPCEPLVPTATESSRSSATTICIESVSQKDGATARLLYEPLSKTYSLAYEAPSGDGPLFGLVRHASGAPIEQWGPGASSATIPLNGVGSGEDIVFLIHRVAVEDSSFAHPIPRIEWRTLNGSPFPVYRVTTERGDGFFSHVLERVTDHGSVYDPLSTNVTGRDFRISINVQPLLSLLLTTQEIPPNPSACP